MAEIKRLKARVEDVSQRNSRYNLLTSNDDSSPAAAADHQHQLLMSRSKEATGAIHVLREAWKANGKLCTTTDSDDLKWLIYCHGSERQVISLWGGTTPSHAPHGHGGNEAVDDDVVGCIMRKAYDDPKICREFKNRAWVNYKRMHPFNPVHFVRNLLTQFRSHHHDFIIGGDDDDDRAAGAGTTLSELMVQLRQHRYLVVIEQQLTSVSDWVQS